MSRPRWVDEYEAHLGVVEPEQLALPFLTRDDVATIDAARVAVERSQGAAMARRAWAEADEMGRLGTQLVELLERHASAVRSTTASHPARRDTLAVPQQVGVTPGQVLSTGIERPERSQ